MKCEAQLNYVLSFVDAKKIKRALEQPIPSELFDLYQLVIDAHARSTSDSGPLVQKILSWIFHAKRPLQMAELQEALAVEDGDVDLEEDDLTPAAQIVQVSGNFVSYDTASGIVRFSHDTMRDFLQDRCINYLSHESELAITCLTYLLFELFADGPCTDERSFALRLSSRPFGKYAAHYWGSHTKGPGENNTTIQKLLSTLVKSSAKIDSMAQLAVAQRPKDWNNVVRGKTIWHLVAENDLTILAAILTQRTIAVVCPPYESNSPVLGSSHSRGDGKTQSRHPLPNGGWLHDPACCRCGSFTGDGENTSRGWCGHQ